MNKILLTLATLSLAWGLATAQQEAPDMEALKQGCEAGDAKQCLDLARAVALF